MKISWLHTVAGLAVVGTVVRAAFFTPLEAKQGAAQKIFYIHVPAAWVAFLAFGLVAIASAAIPLAARSAPRSIRRKLGRGRRGFHHRGADHRAPLGQADLGNVLGVVGYATGLDAVPVVHLRLVHGSARRN